MHKRVEAHVQKLCSQGLFKGTEIRRIVIEMVMMGRRIGKFDDRMHVGMI